MPLWPDGQPWLPHQPRSSTVADQQPIMIPLTGEVYFDRDACQQRCAQYATAIWTCSVTRKSNLTFMDALASERNALHQHQQQQMASATWQQQAMLMQQQLWQLQARNAQFQAAASAHAQPSSQPSAQTASANILSHPSHQHSSTAPSTVTFSTRALPPTHPTLTPAPPAPIKRVYKLDCPKSHIRFLLQMIHFSQSPIAQLVTDIMNVLRDVYLPDEANLYLATVAKPRTRPLKLLDQMSALEGGKPAYRCLDIVNDVTLTLTHADIWRRSAPLTRLQVKNVIRDTSERQRISNGPLLVYPELVTKFNVPDTPPAHVAQLIEYNEFRRYRRPNDARPTDGSATETETNTAILAYRELQERARATEFEVSFVEPAVKPSKRRKGAAGADQGKTEKKSKKRKDDEVDDIPSVPRPPSVLLDVELSVEDRANEGARPEPFTDWDLEQMHLSPALSTYIFLTTFEHELRLSYFEWPVYCDALLESKTSNLLFHILRCLLVLLIPDKVIAETNSPASRKVLFKLLKSHILGFAAPTSMAGNDWQSLIQSCTPSVALPDIAQRLLVLEWLVQQALTGSTIRKTILSSTTNTAQQQKTVFVGSSLDTLPTAKDDQVLTTSVNPTRQQQLGIDRDGRCYFYLTQIPDRLVTFEVIEGVETWSYYNTFEQVEALYRWLNNKGHNERQLRHNLTRHTFHMRDAMAKAQTLQQATGDEVSPRRTRANTVQTPTCDAYVNEFV
eukprot:m.149645 g.149645  ORF g.149645 m.149645 type:complete len:732 (+) comp16299_c2_seq1:111-2306(+)